MIGILIAILAVNCGPVFVGCGEWSPPKQRRRIIVCAVGTRTNTSMDLALLPGWASLRGFG